MPDRSGSQIDHLNIAVPDLAAAVEFYTPTLDSIGIVTILEIPADHTPGMPAMTGFGWPRTKPFFWLIDQGTVGTCCSCWGCCSPNGTGAVSPSPSSSA